MPTLIRRRPLDVITDRVALAGCRIVDIGCGDGTLVRALTGLGATVIGVECGADMLARARGTEPAGDERYVEGVAQALPLPDGSADRVIFMNSLHHVPVGDMAHALAEAARVLVPGGLCLINEPLAEGSSYELTRLAEDEAEVRAAAQLAIAGACVAGLFGGRSDTVYINPVRYENYEAFATRMGLIDETRKAFIAENDAMLRARFNELAEQRDGAFHFDQPARLSILSKSA